MDSGRRDVVLGNGAVNVMARDACNLEIWLIKLVPKLGAFHMVATYPSSRNL